MQFRKYVSDHAWPISYPDPSSSSLRSATTSFEPERSHGQRQGKNLIQLKSLPGLGRPASRPRQTKAKTHQIDPKKLLVYYPLSGKPFLSFPPTKEFSSIVRKRQTAAEQRAAMAKGKWKLFLTGYLFLLIFQFSSLTSTKEEHYAFLRRSPNRPRQTKAQTHQINPKHFWSITFCQASHLYHFRAPKNFQALWERGR